MNKDEVSFSLACCSVVCQLIVLYNIWALGFSSIIFNYTLLPVVFSIIYCVVNIPKIKKRMRSEAMGFYALFEVSIAIFIIQTGGVVFRYSELLVLELVAAILALVAVIEPKSNKFK